MAIRCIGRNSTRRGLDSPLIGLLTIPPTGMYASLQFRSFTAAFLFTGGFAIALPLFCGTLGQVVQGAVALGSCYGLQRTLSERTFVSQDQLPSTGEVTWLSGRILDARGEPMRNVQVEIWQCDQNGVYFHSKGGDPAKRDKNFQGFGRFATGSSGEYLFRTIKPVPYTGRTPRIHFALKSKGREKWTTQCYIKGEPQNQTDSIYKSLKADRERNALTVPFQPLPGSRTGELAARFDIVTGITPEV